MVSHGCSTSDSSMASAGMTSSVRTEPIAVASVDRRRPHRNLGADS